MVLLNLDVVKEVVERMIKDSTHALFGMAPETPQIALLADGENYLELRKRLLELAHETISKKLTGYSIKFTMQEPIINLESLVTI